VPFQSDNVEKNENETLTTPSLRQATMFSSHCSSLSSRSKVFYLQERDFQWRKREVIALIIECDGSGTAPHLPGPVQRLSPAVRAFQAHINDRPDPNSLATVYFVWQDLGFSLPLSPLQNAAIPFRFAEQAAHPDVLDSRVLISVPPAGRPRLRYRRYLGHDAPDLKTTQRSISNAALRPPGD
jgi:hypothetical protein